MRALVPAAAAWAAVACQTYPFETRPARRVQAKRITEVIATLIPADILLVVDNSGTMQEEIDELRANVGLFISELSQSTNEFQVGLITTDVECNIPSNDCASSTPSFSYSCCNLNPTGCQESEVGGVLSSNCDGGRLRAATTGRRVFGRPAAGDEQAWTDDFGEILAGLGTRGSSYESGLEAAVRAVRCAAGSGCDPRDSTVARLNEGFIRDQADLVIIFVTDEDDCSFDDRAVYERPERPDDAVEQAEKLCWPDECYAGWGSSLDADADGLWDWSDPDADGYLACGNPRTSFRQVNPPEPTPVSDYLDELVAIKGGVGRVRAAGIVSSVRSLAAPLGYEPFGCVRSLIGPSNDCGCLSTSTASDLWCEVTGEAGGRSIAWPLPPGGCEAMPSGRYAEFLQLLSDRRRAAGESSDTLISSICRSSYDETMFNIVNSIILSNCFDLGEVPGYLASAGGGDLPCGDGTSCRDGDSSMCVDATTGLCSDRDQFEKLTFKRNGQEVPHIGLEAECTRFSPSSVCDLHGDASACTGARCTWRAELNRCIPDAQGCIDADCEWNAAYDGGRGACDVLTGEENQGWSWVTGASRICLENGLEKGIDDAFEIFLLTGSTTP
jgi:hypothetical protein